VISHLWQQVVIVHIEIFKLSILKIALPIDAISKALIFVKSKNISLFYNRNNPRIMNFNVKVLRVPTPLVKNKHISVSKYNFFNV